MTLVTTPAALLARVAEAAAKAAQSRVRMSGIVTAIRHGNNPSIAFCDLYTEDEGSIDVMLVASQKLKFEEFCAGLHVTLEGWANCKPNPDRSCITLQLKADTLADVDADKSTWAAEERKRILATARTKAWLPWRLRRIGVVMPHGDLATSQDDIKSMLDFLVDENVEAVRFPANVKDKHSLAEALEKACNDPQVDAVAIARGGDRASAFAVFDSLIVLSTIAAQRNKKPIVLGVGHAANKTPHASALVHLTGSTPGEAVLRLVTRVQQRRYAIIASLTATAVLALWGALG